MRRRRKVATRSSDTDKACTTLECASKVRKVGPACKRNFEVSTVTEGKQASGGAVTKREEEGPNGGEARGEFLNDAQIAKDKSSSLLGSNSLCKAV